ncbi:hypothetical protein BC833DRAFT_623057 [Globomyces pollinis-pini]|nr:hypothetical protein BC833DRAFT_623057 [Globomyces pollinis-pini]
MKGLLQIDCEFNKDNAIQKHIISKCCEYLIKNDSNPSLTILVNCKIEPNWKQFDHFLTGLYNAATKVAFELNLILLDVDIICLDFCGYDYDEQHDIYFTFTDSNLQKENVIRFEKPKLMNQTIEVFDTKDVEEYDNVALGGTFDYLHTGHKILLTMAIWICKKRLICGVTNFSSDRLLKKKYVEYMQSIDVRLEQVKKFLSKVKRHINLHVVPITDDFGPTKTDTDIQALVGSLETAKGCEIVNKVRNELGMNILDIYLVDCVSHDSIVNSNDFQGKLSSSEIREYVHSQHQKS